MGQKKRRTREHVLADLSVNHVERFIYRCGFSCERVEHDYGIDLLMFTYSENGEIENGHVQIQVKATDHPNFREDGRSIACSVAAADLFNWSAEPWPVIVVLYDAVAGRGYWLYIQRDLENRDRRLQILANGDSATGDDPSPKTATLCIPVANLMDCSVLRRFRSFRDRILAQVKGVIRHGD